jgi:hypothetical protein
MIDRRCETCDCWVREGNSDNGACHRGPPSPFPMMGQQSRVVGLDRPQLGQVSFFPMVGKNNWCEEHICSVNKKE